MASLATTTNGEETKSAPIPAGRRQSVVPSDISSLEKTKISELRKLLGESMPINGRDDLTMHRFLVARDWDVAQSQEMMLAHLVWRQEHFPIYRSMWQADKLFANGAIFPHGYDKEGRPVMVIRSGRFCPNERDLEACIKAGIAQTLEMFRRNGGFSKITIIYDRQDFSMSANLDKPLLKAFGESVNSRTGADVCICIYSF